MKLAKLFYAFKMSKRYYSFFLLTRYYWLQWILPFEVINIGLGLLSWYYLGLASKADSSMFSEYGGFISYLLGGLIVNTLLNSSLFSFVGATRFLVRGRVGGKFSQALSFYDYCILTGVPISAPLMAYIFDRFSEGITISLVYLLLGVFLGYSLPLKSLSLYFSAIFLGVLSLIGISLLASALMIHLNAWRGGNEPITWLVSTLSNVFSGLYFPVKVIPSNLRAVSFFLPQTHVLNIIHSSSKLSQINVVFELFVLALMSTVFLSIGLKAYFNELKALKRRPPII